MKIYLMTDLEGVAGVYTWENRADESRENHERRCRQRRWLAWEVNAAAEGFFSAGATEVIVNDGHGAGYTIDIEELDPRVEVIHGQQRPNWLPYLDETFAGTGIVGAHAKAGTEGANLAHTMGKAVKDFSVNGTSIGEMGLQALIAGYYGVPFIFCSGDAYACQEMDILVPGCVTVAVKSGMSILSAKTVPPRRSAEMIREGAKQSLSSIGKVKPLDLGTPLLFREEWHEQVFDIKNPPPYGRVIDAYTREIEAKDIIELGWKLYPSFLRDWKPFEYRGEG
jgi:D-amino peptidase